MLLLCEPRTPSPGPAGNRAAEEGPRHAAALIPTSPAAPRAKMTSSGESSNQTSRYYRAFRCELSPGTAQLDLKQAVIPFFFQTTLSPRESSGRGGGAGGVLPVICGFNSLIHRSVSCYAAAAEADRKSRADGSEISGRAAAVLPYGLRWLQG